VHISLCSHIYDYFECCKVVCSRHAKVVVLFDVPCVPTKFLNYARGGGGPTCPTLRKIKLKIRIRYLRLVHCFMFQLNEVKMCFDEIRICVRSLEIRGTKICGCKFELRISKSSGRDVPAHVVAPRTVTSFFSAGLSRQFDVLLLQGY
jgi:hypothetical protein